MRKLQLLSEGELKQIFGPVDELIPIHEGMIFHTNVLSSTGNHIGGVMVRVPTQSVADHGFEPL
jgi:hypothetical protein